MFRVVLKKKGALLSKPNSFQSRSWRLTSVRSTDLLDGVGSSIKVYFKGSDVVKVLPNRNLKLNDRWISDKVRYFYGDLSYNSIDKAYLKSGEDFKKSTYTNTLLALTDCIDVYASVYGSSSIGFISSSSSSLEDLLEVERSSRCLGCTNSLSDFSQKNIDLSSTYKFNFLFDNLENSDLCVFIGSNIRYEASTINIRLRKIFKKGSLKAFSFGFYPSTTFSLKFLGLSSKSLLKFVEGKSYLSKLFKEAKNPLLIYGSSLLYRKDLRGFEKLFAKLPQYSSLKESACLNFLSTKANFVGSLTLGVKSLSFKNLNDMKLIYMVGSCENLEKLLLKNKNPFIISQHSHIQNMSFLSVVLPARTISEISGYYQNSEGRFQKTNTIVGSFYRDKEEKNVFFSTIINSLYNRSIINSYQSFGRSPICSEKKVKKLLSKINFNFSTDKKFLNSLISTNHLGSCSGYLEKKSWLNVEYFYMSYFKYLIEDFYMTDFCKGSKILGDLSKEKRLKATNYDFLSN